MNHITHSNHALENYSSQITVGFTLADTNNFEITRATITNRVSLNKCDKHSASKTVCEE